MTCTAEAMATSRSAEVPPVRTVTRMDRPVTVGVTYGTATGSPLAG